MVHNRERVSRVVTIGVGTGYWLHQTLKVRSYVWWLWFVVAPLAMKLHGYFPGKRLRKIGDLPLGVMAQWRRACLHRDYLVGVGGEKMRADYAAITTPMLSLSFTDDEYMSARNTAHMHAFYAARRATCAASRRKTSARSASATSASSASVLRATLWPQVIAVAGPSCIRRTLKHNRTRSMETP